MTAAYGGHRDAGWLVKIGVDGSHKGSTSAWRLAGLMIAAAPSITHSVACGLAVH